MSSVSEPPPLNPNDPDYDAPAWLREGLKPELSPSLVALPEPITSPPIFLPSSPDIQLKDEVSNALRDPLAPSEVIHDPAGIAPELDRRAVQFSLAARLAAAAGDDALWKPLDPEVIDKAAGSAPELDQRAAQFGVAARLAATAGVVMVVVLLFVIMMPASRLPNASSTPSEIAGSISTALPQSGQGDVESKPALAEFQALLAPIPPSQPTIDEQSQQLVQQFLQWREKANTTETSR